MHMLVLVHFEKPVHFVDKEIQMKRRLYDQPNTSLDSYNQINESLLDVQNIIRKNIDEVVQRVEKLDRIGCSSCWVDVTNASEQLMDDSKKFRWGAKKLNVVVCFKEMVDH